MEDGYQTWQNMTLKEVVEEIKACEEDRRLVSKFEMKYPRYLD